MKSAEGYPNIHQDHHFGDHDATKALSGAEEFDFIIVGSGASGATLANRLSEVPEWKVLLLEAGDIETTITQVPSMQPYLMSTPYTWEYHTVPQNKSCQCKHERL
ncbi:hypothetical protein NQ317_018258 [Molorchus minor]|uniref:Glucose-methanol-choline oxidoreductase N-terminal domain-containing protein n=1 Tax=Molorchus minor TaxID=1323400 RepID=A0ABQ9K506_9CUCU|nr:hypothetical protein NQ317_018258 [Molorchus minor]